MNPTSPQQWKILLAAEKERLEKELASFAVKDPRMPDDWDALLPAASPLGASLSHSSLEEQADLREAFEAELAQEQSLELRLAEVNRALQRLEAGTFGRCQGCGNPIAEERLRANPAAEYDMGHQPKE